MKIKQKRRFVKVNGVKVYTNELEEKGLPKKRTINQLRRGPKVHLEKMDLSYNDSSNSSPISSSSNSVLLTETSKNHPNLANVANYEECCSNNNEDSGRTSPSSSFVDETTTEIFSSLKSLFGKDAETSTSSSIRNKKQKKCEKKKKRCHSTQELLISIFGSSFDDDDDLQKAASPPKQPKLDSLPVSIDISAIHPLPAVLVQNKAFVSEVPALSQRCEHFRDEYTDDLVRPYVKSERLEFVEHRAELFKAIVAEKPDVFCDFRTVKIEKAPPVVVDDIVDLTLDEQQQQPKEKPPAKTGVPILASMPLLSPELPDAQPMLPETTRCEKSVVSSSQAKNAQEDAKTAQVLSESSTVFPVFKIQVKPFAHQAPEKNAKFALVVTPEEKKTPVIPTTVLQIPKTYQRRPPVPIPPPKIPATNQENLRLKKLLGNCNSANSSSSPQRYPLSFVLISNDQCADKLYVYCSRCMFWQRQRSVFVEATRIYENSSGFRAEMESFAQFIDVRTKDLSRELIQELQAIDVDKFDMNLIMKRIYLKFGKHFSNHVNLPRICTMLVLLLEPSVALCTTPFTKKLLNIVLLSKRYMEIRARTSEQVAKLFSREQMKLLQDQITQYHKIVETQLILELQVQQHQRNLIMREQQRQRLASEMQARAFLLQKQKWSLLPPQLRLLEKTISNVGQPVAPPPPVIQLSDNFTLAPSNFIFPRININSLPQQTVANERVKTPPPPVAEIEQPAVVSAEKVKQEPMSGSPENTKQIEVKAEVKSEIIDLTWMDDCDDNVIFEEIVDYSLSQIKTEIKTEHVAGCVSPTDSGVGGSPVPLASFQNNENYKCLCGEEANFTCACDTIYCSATCQMNDWSYHKTICTKVVNN